jgi:hypothetical protein
MNELLQGKLGQYNKQLQQGCHVSALQVLKEGWQDYKPSNEKSLFYFVGQKMADTYQNMRISASGREFEDWWERVYVPVIKKKYQT